MSNTTYVYQCLLRIDSKSCFVIHILKIGIKNREKQGLRENNMIISQNKHSVKV